MTPQRAQLAFTLGKSIYRPVLGQTLNTVSKSGLCGFFHAQRVAQNPRSKRQFSSSTRQQLETFPPPKNAPNIKLTPPAWKHPVSTEQQMRSITVSHRKPRSFSDRWAYSFVRLLKAGTDFCTGYKHDPAKPYAMTEKKWLVRFIFLETVAGVPGIVGGMIRHLRSLRRMKRDHGYIELLFEDAYNERMHLLTFLQIAAPGWFMKFMVLGAQGVFVNAYFFFYLFFPKTSHRFVGYLEETAVSTYSLAIQDLEEGKLPAWNDLDAPEIAIQYWSMPEGHRKMKDLLLYVRADEAKHREIHHTLANLQPDDPNPFVSVYKDDKKPHPGRGLENLKPEGWERKDCL